MGKLGNIFFSFEYENPSRESVERGFQEAITEPKTDGGDLFEYAGGTKINANSHDKCTLFGKTKSGCVESIFHPFGENRSLCHNCHKCGDALV